MRKCASLIVVFFGILYCYAQDPDWFDAKNRMAFYPAELYFSGFSMDKLPANADVNEALERVKAAAQAEAASTVRVYVQSVKQDNTRSESYQTMSKYVEEIYQQFSSTTTLTTEMEIPGLQVKYHQKGNIIAAFAYVKKSDFSRKLEKEITMGLTRIETRLDDIAELMNNGEKVEARTRLMPVAKDFLPVEQSQELLLAVNPNADMESLQLEETKALQQRYSKMKAALKNGIYVALYCEAQLFDGTYDALPELIKGNLSELGCTFTEDDAQADWIITVHSKVRESNVVPFGESTAYFVYVNSKLNVKKVKTDQLVYSNEISVKGSDTRDLEHAAQEAYKESAPKLSEMIKKQIQQ